MFLFYPAPDSLLYGVAAMLGLFGTWRVWRHRTDIWPFLRRAWDSAHEDVGRDVRLGIIAAILSGLLCLIAGLPWAWSVVIAVAPWTIVLASYVCWHAIQHWKNPCEHHRWKSTVIIKGGSIVEFKLESKIGLQVHPGIACEVSFPSGEHKRCEDDRRDTPYELRPTGTWSLLATHLVPVQNDFPEIASPIGTGLYRVTWSELGRSGKWREIIKCAVTATKADLSASWAELG